jgi:hypothetical protein
MHADQRTCFFNAALASHDFFADSPPPAWMSKAEYGVEVLVLVLLLIFLCAPLCPLWLKV